MALKRFEEYAKDFLKKEEVVKTDKIIIKGKINENSFLVGNDYKVKIVVDVPQSLVKEYIDKVKSETDKNPLDNFSESEIAEQMISFIVKKNLIIDNLSSDFTVGTENLGSSEKSRDNIESDAEDLTDDLGVSDSDDLDNSDGEIEFNDYNESDEEQTDNTDEDSGDEEIEFDDSDTKEKDLGEEREVDESDSDPDSNFDEIEFDDNNSDNSDNSKPKTIGDLKTNQTKKIENKHKEESKQPSEEEETIDDLYHKVGYKVGYFEKLDLTKLRKY